ncbi:alpha/beta hydrolase [Siccirubricoccus sp. KC 17139]|uniref:Alpha/beta hydrolase n=1 Tax=Siccirubricoccus soli TaxID=2899147 RepID=A0ABT1D101_9PROT|nr:alpha/beta hydrolase [Siccirubricoccus soli]MCO6415582.1 alpha/beta hydrolase [Siccirubricoccus soli]MCP2681714.1 alpha/beta hydrolase [Siccirubricoccus soli]
MPSITTDDGVELAYEEAGTGIPLLFVHEFAGDMRSWEPQLRFFARRYRCIAFNARGYPPSGVPHDQAAYSQDRATDDIAAVITALGLAPAHVVGLSMGAFATLHLGLRYPHLARSLTAAGVGYGAQPGKRDQFRGEVDTTADKIAEKGMWKMSRVYGSGPTRLVFEEKDPRGYAEFLSQLAEHDTDGAVLTMRGVQRERPSLFELEAEFRKLKLPTFIICGDEDDPTLEPGLFLKRTIPTSSLLVMPRCGHTMNIEDPDAFNRAVLDFITWVDAGRWWERNPATLAGGIIAGTAKG